MIDNNIYSDFFAAKNSGSKRFAVLIDPDKMRLGNINSVIESSLDAGVDYFFVGGSFFVKPDQKVTYTITSNSILDQQANIEYELWSQGKLIIAKNSIDFTYTFT